MSLTLDPLSITTNTILRITVQNPNTVASILLSNKSFMDLKVSGVEGGGDRWVVAGTEVMLNGEDTFSGVMTILPLNTANIPSTTVSVILVTIFYVGDELPSGSWPVSIPSQVVNSTVALATQVQNDGNPGGTFVVEAKPSGASASTVVIDNSGNVTIQSSNGNIVMKVIPSSGTSEVDFGVSGLFRMIMNGTYNFNNATVNFNAAAVSHFLAAINTDAPGTTFATSSGTCTMFQPFTGNGFKLLQIINEGAVTGGSNLPMALPAPFTKRSMFIGDNVGGWFIQNGGSNQSIGQVNASNGGGSTVSTTPFTNWTYGSTGPFDTFVLGSGGSAHSGVITFIGV